MGNVHAMRAECTNESFSISANEDADVEGRGEDRGKMNEELYSGIWAQEEWNRHTLLK